MSARGSARAWGRLLRLSLAPSAAADVAAGLVLGGRGWFPTGAAPWLLMAAALAIYTGALALNDWADRDHDRRTRPERPLPSGAVQAGAALAAALALLAAGVGLAFAAGRASGAWMLALAGLAVLYDLRGRGPLRGPLLLSLCRAGNLAAGLGLGSGSHPPAAGLTLVALLYGLFVFLASRLGRMEDSEDELSAPRARRLVASAALVFPALSIACSLPLPGLPGGGLPLELPLALVAAAGLVPAARRRAWTLPDVQRTMGLLLRRLLVFSAVLALAATRFPEAPWDGALVAAAILLGYPLAHQLRRLFPPS